MMAFKSFIKCSKCGHINQIIILNKVLGESDEVERD